VYQDYESSNVAWASATASRRASGFGWIRAMGGRNSRTRRTPGIYSLGDVGIGVEGFEFAALTMELGFDGSE